MNRIWACNNNHMGLKHCLENKKASSLPQTCLSCQASAPSNAQTTDDGAQLLGAVTFCSLCFVADLNICIPLIDSSRSFSINLPLFITSDSLLFAFMIMLAVLLLRS